MANSGANELQRSDLNSFLFADVGVEASGMTLSVLSTLARRGMDPWQEAGRLAKLPRADAADGLARIIAAMPASHWPLADATTIATRLVALLPARGGVPSLAPPPKLANAMPVAVWLRTLLPAGGAPSAQSARPAFPALLQRVVVLVLLGAVLGGLALNLTTQRGAASDKDAAAHWSNTPASSAAPSADHTPAGK